MSIQVTSEIGKLKGVITHTPGYEVSLVTPDIKNKLLFDDLIFEEDARVEHIEMLNIIKKVLPDAQVLEVVDMLKEAFTNPEAREFFLDQLIRSFPDENLHSIEHRLNDLMPESLTRFAVFGRTPELKNFTLLPTPNLLFTRDLAAVIGRTVVISRAAKTARIRESLMMDTIVRYHPLYKDVAEHVIRIPREDSIEGGDILVASENLVLIGMSERTSFSGVMRAGEALLRQGVGEILIVDIPKQRSSMHLDTIFTFSDYNECVVYPPAIIDRKKNVVSLKLNNGAIHSELKMSLKSALEETMGYEFSFIKCGGEDPTTQQREQWSDGANLFALAPGIVIGYERNVHTFSEMERYGYEVISGRDFLKKYKDKPFKHKKGQKLTITFEGHELCRGRGGARCMTQPFSRENI